MLVKEYRICMPLTVEEYRIGQLYMIARHSLEQSENGEGVETVVNSPCEDEKYGKGQFTEKRIYLASRLPFWLQPLIPKIFYITEKAWNFYPYTLTEYTCSFVPKLNITIKTKFEDNKGDNENALGLNEEQLTERSVDVVDIAYDELNSKHQKDEEDPKLFHSVKTNRGPLQENWINTVEPIMCSYKVVEASFEVWGMQTKCEDLIQKSIRDVLLLGHRQAFTWVDEWINMSIDDVRLYESELQRETNTKINPTERKKSSSSIDEGHQRKGSSSKTPSSTSSRTSSPPVTPTDKVSKSWFS